MKRKNGFTLIELLAVIVILAILALIATPIVLDVINQARSKAYLNSTYGILDTAKLYRIDRMFNDEEPLVDTNILDILVVSGQKPETGELYLKEDGSVAIALKYGNKCYKKDYDTAEITVETYAEETCYVVIPTNPACFAFDASTKTITKYYEYENDNSSKPVCPNEVIIPSRIKGTDVEVIGYEAFVGRNVTGIIFPSTLKKIDEKIFHHGKLTGTIKIPRSVISIGAHAFNGEADGSSNNITSVIFESPSQLKTIGYWAFANNKINETLTIPKSVESIDEYAFWGEYDGTTNKISTLIFEGNSNLKTIGAGAFGQNNLSETVVIPNSVTSIGAHAFQGNSNGLTNKLAEVIFENGGTSNLTIGSWAFAHNKLSGNISIPSNVISIDEYAFYAEHDGSTNNIASLSFESNSQLQSIGNWAFRNNKLTGTLIIPKNTLTIGEGAFYGDSDGSQNQITKLIIENESQLQSIGNTAFHGNAITSIINPTGIAFTWCQDYNGIIATSNCNPNPANFATGTFTTSGRTVKVCASEPCP